VLQRFTAFASDERLVAERTAQVKTKWEMRARLLVYA
jgi:hypothetical protein